MSAVGKINYNHIIDTQITTIIFAETDSRKTEDL